MKNYYNSVVVTGRLGGIWVRPLSLQSIVVSVQVHMAGHTCICSHPFEARFSIPLHFISSSSISARFLPLRYSGEMHFVFMPNLSLLFSHRDNHASRQSQIKWLSANLLKLLFIQDLQWMYPNFELLIFSFNTVWLILIFTVFSSVDNIQIKDNNISLQTILLH